MSTRRELNLSLSIFHPLTCPIHVLWSPWKVSVLLYEISLIFVGVECPFPYILTILFFFSRWNVYNTSPFWMWHDFCVLCYPGQAGIVVSMRDSEKAEDSFPFMDSSDCWLMPFTVLSSVETQRWLRKAVVHKGSTSGGAMKWQIEQIPSSLLSQDPSRLKGKGFCLKNFSRQWWGDTINRWEVSINF